MKNMLENVAVITVVVLFLLIMGLIVQYNMVDDENILDESTYEIPVEKEESKKSKTHNYLQNMESYSDVDVKVDPTKANNINKVQVRSELEKDEISSAVDNADKSSYVNSLENYVNQEKADKEEDDQIKPDQQEIVDEVGNAIDAALEDN